MKLLDRYLGWATPIAPHSDYASLAEDLGHSNPLHDCLARRQGHCPGLEFCSDCAWREGTTREIG